MLTQAQVQQARQTLGITPVAGGTGATQDRAADFAKALGNNPQPDQNTETPDTNSLGADDAKETLAGAQQAASSVETAGARVTASPSLTPGGGTNAATALEDELGKTGDLAEGAAGAIVGGARSVFAPLTATIQKLSQMASDNPTIQKLAMSPQIGAVLDAANDAKSPLSQFAAANPRAATDISNALQIALLAAGGGEADPLLNASVGEAASGLKGAASDGFSNLHQGISDLFSSSNPEEAAGQAIAKSPGGIMDTIRGKLAETDPRLSISASRLDDPAGEYEKMAQEATAHVSDAKADAPTQRIGSEIGDQYDNVGTMRRTVGQQMGNELDKVKGTTVSLGGSPNISDAYQTFAQESQKGAGKMTSFDQGLIQKYGLELKALGNNPTAKDLDDFLGRVPEELHVAKSASNITKTTNAERIIKGSLASIRDTLTSAPGMGAYKAARQSYANLSQFLDEGSKYLGTETQAGDYTRDASLAKSAVESLVGGGKKDWLLKLQGLTGYPAVDKIVLGIQAMKDAGDPSGLSLFKAMSQGEIPTSPESIAGKLLSWGLEKGKTIVAGSPAERTAAFLRSLKK